eukprot:gnl/MRDRNA2_/MRDRNA2_149331_c0_seq1.p1 gnl/MRDRNA2_/MRDRNA2_149331_c0~~gnl/MRDRNA2_/MRDRNA2_149331_c0_seq1.p1  ORF type:complete len:222 (-),score=47.37 gnl/MRDRNA2_/MRDRNA2_149331_c0_seq1:50-715(-)
MVEARGKGSGGALKREADQVLVVELLRDLGARDAQQWYDSKVRGKVLRLDNPRGQFSGIRSSRLAVGQRASGSEARTQGFFAITKQPSFTHAEMLPLHELWTEYAEGLVPAGAGKEAVAAVSSMDLHGSILEVVRAKNPGCVGTQGIVVQETQNTFRIISEDDKVRTFPKESSVFAVHVRGERWAMLGPAWTSRAPHHPVKGKGLQNGKQKLAGPILWALH